MADDNRLVAGIELGGTKSIALIARGRAIIAQARFPTGMPATTIEALGRQIERWTIDHGRPEALGIASFGPVGLDRGRPDYGHITSTPKPGWADVDLVGHFTRRFGVPVGFDTDVAGAALAEYRWGAAQGCPVVIYLTIGTGVGGAVLVDGAPVHGGVHPEIGHIRVRRAAGDGFAGSCPYHGDCLEGLVSGPAIAARAGMPGAGIGDDHPLWAAVGGEIAEAMAILMLTLSPQRILVGGGVFQHRAKLFAAIHRRTAELLNSYVAGASAAGLAHIITPPGLGDQAGPLGAVALAQAALGDDPRRS
jgi:fructokinase